VNEVFGMALRRMGDERGAGRLSDQQTEVTYPNGRTLSEDRTLMVKFCYTSITPFFAIIFISYIVLYIFFYPANRKEFPVTFFSNANELFLLFSNTPKFLSK